MTRAAVEVVSRAPQQPQKQKQKHSSTKLAAGYDDVRRRHRNINHIIRLVGNLHNVEGSFVRR